MYGEVVLNLPLEQSFTYLIPPESACRPGCRVEVNFRGRKCVGFVVAVNDEKPAGNFAVKEIRKLIDPQPIFGDEELDLARWTAKRYFSTLGEALGAMLPGGRQESAVPSILPEDETPGGNLELSDEQQAAVEAILGDATHERKPVYLYGITGSGKTEVYLRAAEQILNRGGEVLYLVPEISLTHQIVREAQSRFGSLISVWHSRITPSMRLKEWRRIRGGEARMVIGARSAVFAPLRRLELIIIDEEHEGSYKSGASPRYHARQIALHRAASAGAALVMGSATPSAEAVALMHSGKLLERKLNLRLSGGAPPAMQIVDMKGEKNVISARLTERIKTTLGAGRQVILFLNRRGFSYFFHCKSCGFEMRCSNCSVALTLHKSRGTMLCHYCGYQTRPVEVCPDCGSLDVGYSGYGTEGIEAEIAGLFPAARLARIDTDSVARKGVLQATLEQFRRGEIDILLGTQMVAKGLNFPGVKLVGIIMADTTMLLPDFRAAERTYALLTQVAGRAGRFHPDGEVLIQTFHPNAPAIALAAESKAEEFYRQELEMRRSLRFPPFARLVRILFRGKDPRKVEAAAEEFCAYLRRDLPAGTELLGPGEAPLALIAGNHRVHAILKGSSLGQSTAS